jgi:L-seryl-tRNA(Ser) seleniumtransferase
MDPQPHHQLLRHLPSVDRLLRALLPIPGLPAPLATEFIRRTVHSWRLQASAGSPPPGFDEAVAQLSSQLATLARSRIQPVINATGILIHTNLGRSPLAGATAHRVAEIASSYHNLEFSLESGSRGPRGRFLEESLALLAGAEAATVVNNCAAALILILRHFTSPERPEVVISRGQLVEIGGGFRIPEIMETSGATLREIGTTNRTSADDYRRAISARTALILRVHRSNFYIEGFTGEPSLTELASIAREHHIPLAEDLGSGAMTDTAQFPGLEHEPTAAESLAAGADLVCCSGDKLFGGPQSGLIFGRSNLVQALKRDPLFRALRCDRLAFIALQETAAACLDAGIGGVPHEIPLMAMLSAPAESLMERAHAILPALQGLPADFSVVPAESQCGGGTMPKSALPSAALRIAPHQLSPDSLAARLRTAPTPVIARITDHALVCDLRSVFPRDDQRLAAALRSALTDS